MQASASIIFICVYLINKSSTNGLNHTLLGAFRTWHKLPRSFPDPVCNFVYDQAISLYPGLFTHRRPVCVCLGLSVRQRYLSLGTKCRTEVT